VLAIGQGTDMLGIILGEEYGPRVRYTPVTLDDAGNLFDEDRNPLGNDPKRKYMTEPLIEDKTFNCVMVINTYNPNPIVNDHTLGEIEGLVYEKGSDIIEQVQDFNFVDYLERVVLDTMRAHEFGLLMSAARSVSENGRIVRIGVLPYELLEGMENLMKDCGFELTYYSSLNISEETAHRYAIHEAKRVGATISPDKLESIAAFCFHNFGIAVFDKKGPFNEEALPSEYKLAGEKYPDLGVRLDLYNTERIT